MRSSSVAATKLLAKPRPQDGSLEPKARPRIRRNRDRDGVREEENPEPLKEIPKMKNNRWKRKAKPRSPVRLFVEQLEIRAMPTGLTVNGTDGAKHETAAKEENFASFAQGVTFNEVIDVRGTGINQGQTVNWTLAYVSGYGNDSTLSPVTGISPSSGALTLNHVHDLATLTFNTSTLAVQTYHGELLADGGAGISQGPYFFTFIVSAATNPVV